MTCDEIIKMAREAGEAEGMVVVFHPVMERFAALVAAAEREAIKAVIHEHDCDDGVLATDDVLAAIRARGEQ